MFTSKFFVAVVVFVLLVLARELWRICMVFYNVRQVRSVLMEGWYQWSLHGGQLSTMRRLGVLFSMLSLYEEYGVSILPGFDLFTLEEIEAMMDPERGLTEEQLIRVTDMFFRYISKIRNEEEVIAA